MARIPAHDRRKALVDATIRLISREGIAATSTRAIAAEADMPLSSLHYVFDSREQLIALAVNSIAADFRMRFDTEAIDFSSVASAVRTAFGQRLEFVNDHPDMTLAAYECLMYAARTEELKDLGARRWDEDVLLIRFLLEVLCVRNRLRLKAPSVSLAVMVLTTIEGILFAWTKTRDTGTALIGVDAIVAVVERNVEPLPEGEEPEVELIGSEEVHHLLDPVDEPEGAGVLEQESTQ